MRRHRLLPIPLALSLALAAAAPASAAEVEVGVVDFDFQPATRAIAVGDTVIWRFNSGGHTSTASRGQAERWDSGTRSSGQEFRRTFRRPGRFQYVCIPHAGFMRGTIQVGTDQVRDTVDGFRARRSGSTVTVSFRVRNLDAGSYSGTLTLKDDFDKSAKPKSSFVIR